MEINTNFGAPGVGGPVPPNRPAAKPAAPGETAAFTHSTALETALQGTPDVRPEAVERAKGLINDAAWPPAETIRAISDLLANQTAPGAE